jgi:hypothetical protein
MANDLFRQAILSDILACLTYKPSGRLQEFDYGPWDIVQGKLVKNVSTS